MNTVINKLLAGFKSLIYTYVILFLGIKIYDSIFGFNYKIMEVGMSIIIGIVTLALLISTYEYIAKRIFSN